MEGCGVRGVGGDTVNIWWATYRQTYRHTCVGAGMLKILCYNSPLIDLINLLLTNSHMKNHGAKAESSEPPRSMHSSPKSSLLHHGIVSHNFDT